MTHEDNCNRTYLKLSKTSLSCEPLCGAVSYGIVCADYLCKQDALMGSMKIQDASKQLRIATPAKVNLFFELLGKRTDGFHEVETVMSTISLFDFLEVEPRSDDQIKIEIHHLIDGQSATVEDEIPVDERNLVYQAFDSVRKFLLRENRVDSTSNLGVNVSLEKRIPSSAGLGGASSDAAAAIIAARQIWNVELSEFEMREIASEIGSDVPFFLDGGLAICRGRGELIEPFDAPASLSLVVAKPSVGLSTAEVYRNSSVPEETQSSQSLIAALTSGNANEVAGGLFNRLETFAESMTPAIAELRNQFSDLSCLGHQMSGSGSSYFGLFKDFADARRAAGVLRSRQPTWQVHCCRTLGPTTRTDMTTNSDNLLDSHDGRKG